MRRRLSKYAKYAEIAGYNIMLVGFVYIAFFKHNMQSKKNDAK